MGHYPDVGSLLTATNFEVIDRNNVLFEGRRESLLHSLGEIEWHEQFIPLDFAYTPNKLVDVVYFEENVSIGIEYQAASMLATFRNQHIHSSAWTSCRPGIMRR